MRDGVPWAAIGLVVLAVVLVALGVRACRATPPPTAAPPTITATWTATSTATPLPATWTPTATASATPTGTPTPLPPTATETPTRPATWTPRPATGTPTPTQTSQVVLPTTGGAGLAPWWWVLAGAAMCLAGLAVRRYGQP